MRALRIVGWILASVITAFVVLVWFLIFPFSGENADKVGFVLAAILYFTIFIIASAAPFVIGTVGAIMSGVKCRGRGVASFVVIALLPATVSVLMLLSTYLI